MNCTISESGQSPFGLLVYNAVGFGGEGGVRVDKVRHWLGNGLMVCLYGLDNLYNLLNKPYELTSSFFEIGKVNLIN